MQHMVRAAERREKRSVLGARPLLSSRYYFHPAIIVIPAKAGIQII
jgi:hypothetical protein